MYRLLAALVATCQSTPTYRVGCVYETAVVTAFVLAPTRAQCARLDDPDVLAFAALQTGETLHAERMRWIVPMKQLGTDAFGIAGYRIDRYGGPALDGTVTFRMFAKGTFVMGEVQLAEFTAGD
jgi:hypothetical protein